MFRQKTDGRMDGGDYIFDTYDEADGVVHVRVSQEALEDWADPRGFKGTADQIFAEALEDILVAVENVFNRDRSKHSIIVKTADLNR